MSRSSGRRGIAGRILTSSRESSRRNRSVLSGFAGPCGSAEGRVAERLRDHAEVLWLGDEVNKTAARLSPRIARSTRCRAADARRVASLDTRSQLDRAGSKQLRSAEPEGKM